MHAEEKPSQVEMDAMLGSLSNHDNRGNHGNRSNHGNNDDVRLEFHQFARLIDMKVDKKQKDEKTEDGILEMRTKDEKVKHRDRIMSIDERNMGDRNVGWRYSEGREMEMGNLKGGSKGSGTTKRYLEAKNWMDTETEDEENEPGIWFADV